MKTASFSILLLCAAAFFFASVALLADCKEVTPAVVTAGVDVACTVIGLVDPAGLPIAEVCEANAVEIGSIIDSVIADIASDQAPAMSLSFVPITRAGIVIGRVRADIASKVQAKLDALDGGSGGSK